MKLVITVNGEALILEEDWNRVKKVSKLLYADYMEWSHIETVTAEIDGRACEISRMVNTVLKSVFKAHIVGTHIRVESDDLICLGDKLQAMIDFKHSKAAVI